MLLAWSSVLIYLQWLIIINISPHPVYIFLSSVYLYSPQIFIDFSNQVIFAAVSFYGFWSYVSCPLLSSWMTLLFKERQVLEVCLPKAAVISFTWKIIPSKLVKSSRPYSFFPHILNKMKIFRSLTIALCQLINRRRTDPGLRTLVHILGWTTTGYAALGKSINISETLHLHIQSGMIISDFQVCSEV